MSERVHTIPEEEQQHNLEIIEFNRELAKKHAVDQFVLLDHDPATYPFQGGYVHRGDPQPAEIIDSVANDYDPRFGIFRDLSEKDPHYTQTLKNMADTLSQNGNVVLAMDHGDLVNIAVGMAVVYRDLQQLQVPFRAVTIVNAPVQYIGVKAQLGGQEYVVPTFSALSLMLYKTYSTYADTDSTRSGASELIERHIESQNKHALVDLGREKRGGGLLIGAAGSGRTDRKIDDTIVLGSVSNGTVKLLTKGQQQHVVYMAARGQAGENPVFEVVGEAMNPQPDDFHAGYDAIAQVLSARTGKKFIYEGPKD